MMCTIPYHMTLNDFGAMCNLKITLREFLVKWYITMVFTIPQKWCYLINTINKRSTVTDLTVITQHLSEILNDNGQVTV